MKRHALLLLTVLVFGAAASAQWGHTLMTPPPNMGETKISISPAQPTTMDEVFVTVCGWTPAANYGVYDTGLRIEAGEIWLDLYWNAPGVGGAAFSPYEYTKSLGRLAAGTYTLHVTNRGLSGTASTEFTVLGYDAPVAPVIVLDPPSIDPPSPSEPGFGSPEWWEQRRAQMQERFNGPGDLPGFEVHDVPWSEVTTIKEGISSLSISPAEPTSSEMVSVTVSGWKPSNDIVVDYADLRTQGHKVWLDLYWHTRPVSPVVQLQDSQTMTTGSVVQMQAMASEPVPITRYQMDDPYDGRPYEVTEPLGAFSPGNYTLVVTNHGPVSGEASTTFTVQQTTPPGAGFHRQGGGGAPWWWDALGGSASMDLL